MRLLPRMPPHMHHQHVLSLEGLLVPGAPHPSADEGLLAGVDVVRVDMLHQVVLGGELEFAVHLERKKILDVKLY